MAQWFAKDDDGWDYVVVLYPSEMISHVLRALFFTLFHVPTFTRAFSRATFFAHMQISNTRHAIMRATMWGHDVTVCACIFFLAAPHTSRRQIWIHTLKSTRAKEFAYLHDSIHISVSILMKQDPWCVRLMGSVCSGVTCMWLCVDNTWSVAGRRGDLDLLKCKSECWLNLEISLRSWNNEIVRRNSYLNHEIRPESWNKISSWKQKTLIICVTSFGHLSSMYVE